jgi:hypothetical protein
VKEYFPVTRVLALLVAVMLTVPTVAPLVCDWTCGLQHSTAAPPAQNCHDHGAPQSTAPVIAGSHTCHDIGVLAASVLRDADQLVLPAVTRAVDPAVDDRIGHTVVASHARQTGHAPPPLALPLRI